MEIEYLKYCKHKKDLEKMACKQSYWPKLWANHVREQKGYYDTLCEEDARVRIISEKNFRERSNKLNCNEMGIHVKIGDICFIDFGMSYLNETGFQHFGVVMKFCNNKAFVVPMSSNANSYQQAYGKESGKGKKHLMRLGKIEGMNKESVLFLNDSRWINTARIIEVMAHIDPKGEMYNEIMERLLLCLK